MLLAGQDRRRWDQLLIQRGRASLQRAEELGGGPYTVQAAIAACHIQTKSVEDTDWRRVAALYTVLAHIAPSRSFSSTEPSRSVWPTGRRGAWSWPISFKTSPPWPATLSYPPYAPHFCSGSATSSRPKQNSNKPWHAPTTPPSAACTWNRHAEPKLRNRK